MAETALSMARSILGSAISKAATAAAEEISLLMGVEKEIWFMKDELKTMQAFLLAAEAMKKKKPLLKVWAEQVRSLSYDIEDCLDEFMVHVGSQSLSKQLMKLKDRHRIAVRIRNLKLRVEEVSSRNTRYNLIEPEVTNTDAANFMEDVRNYSASNVDEAELVGFDTPKQKLLDMINTRDTDGDGHARVICVVGMGGLGKTTLVRKIYEKKEDFARKFSCSAWITVSQSFSKIEIVKYMIMQLLGHASLMERLKEIEGKGTMHVDELARYLRDKLKEMRYFVVLDDLWNISDWDWIRNISLPTTNNKASQIIVTTRNAELAKTCATNSTLIYHLEPLQEEQAITLLLRKLKKKTEDMEKDEKVKNIVRRLVKKCGRLPLAILTIGALFATKHESEWEKLYTQLPSELETNLNLEAIRSMVALSYNHLPSHLKPCFLYLSIFPEDFEITRRRLVDRWIAEGLVRPRVGMTLEDVAKHYFHELISRSMIQPVRLNLAGLALSCRVHDIMRDIIVSFSREEGFVYTSGDSAPSPPEENFRHVAYHAGKCSMVDMDWGRVRSLTCFGERPVDHADSLCSFQLRMLRDLDLKNATFKVTQKDISNIGVLHHLKYVRIPTSNFYIYALPRSIGKLKGLQVLDLGRSYISTLPTEICELQSLRSLCCDSFEAYHFFNPYSPTECLKSSLRLPMSCFTPLVDSEEQSAMIAELYMAYSKCWSEATGVKVPRGIGNLKELQILEVVSIKRSSRKAIANLGELNKLRKLKVSTEGAKRKKCMTLCKAMQKLSSLGSLRIVTGWDGTLEWLGSFSSPPVRTLVLGGHIGDKVDWFRNLTQLVKLYLHGSGLEEGKAVEILGALPNLVLIYLTFNAYAGKELVFRRGAFRNLRKLVMSFETQLAEIRFEQDTSPQMESLEVSYCTLKRGINGIRHLPKLKEIVLGDDSKVARLGTLQGEVHAHPNRPVLRLAWDRSKHDLGDPDESSGEYFDAVESLLEHDGEDSEAATPTAGES